MAPRRSLEATLALLMLATLVSFGSWSETGSLGAKAAGSAVTVLAMAKVWLIGMRFMELERTRSAVRLVFDSWIAAVGTLILATIWLR